MIIDYLVFYLGVLKKISKNLGIADSNLESIEDFNWSYISKNFCFRSIFLKGFVQKMNISVRTIVEIGVWKGEASEIFNLLFPKAKLFLIDPWKLYSEYFLEGAFPMTVDGQELEEAYRRVQETFRDNPKCKLIRKSSLDAVCDVPDNLDLVFIDGNHSYKYVKQDIDIWLPKVRSGGILSGHDYPRCQGVKKAVDEKFGKDIQVGCDCTWVYVKP